MLIGLSQQAKKAGSSNQPCEAKLFASRALSPVSEREWGHIPTKMSEIRFFG